MNLSSGVRRRIPAVICCVVLGLSAAACGPKTPPRPADPAVADRYLMDRGREAVERKRWIDAREYFRELVENYPASPLRPDAKLAIADAYLAEGSTESLVLAANEYREFLTFYPNDQRADQAQYSIAMTFFKQMRSPHTDQTATKEALAEFDVFFKRFPNSALSGEAKQNWRIARDRLSMHSYNVAVGYYKRRWYPGAVDRFREIMREDPGFSRMDGVYYHLAESYARADNTAEAIPLFERVVKEYATSEHFDSAQERLQELQAQ